MTDGQNIPFAFAGRETYNGDGTMSGIFSGIDSTGVTRSGTYPGVYTVNEDCRNEGQASQSKKGPSGVGGLEVVSALPVR